MSVFGTILRNPKSSLDTVGKTQEPSPFSISLWTLTHLKWLLQQPTTVNGVRRSTSLAGMMPECPVHLSLKYHCLRDHLANTSHQASAVLPKQYKKEIQTLKCFQNLTSQLEQHCKFWINKSRNVSKKIFSLIETTKISVAIVKKAPYVQSHS